MAEQPNDCGGKSWERPWSTEEMRKNADKWNLAADAGLLKHLQQFSQVVLSHTHSTEKALDSLLETINTTNTNINNVTNDFLCLANTQFLESRVYDDDESPLEATASDSKQAAQVDGDVMSKVRSALSAGINLLDTKFEPVDQSVSSVENDFMAGARNRSPKNPYADRPLPHLIGSAAFMSDDNVGLIHAEREIEQPSPKAPTMDDLSMYSDESVLTSSVKRNNMDDDSSNTSFCLGDDTPIQHKMPQRDAVSVTDVENDAVPEVKSFADELAGKLAGMLPPENKVQSSSQREPSQGEAVPQNRPSKAKGDMFGVPHSDDEDDDALFSGKSGLFSGGRGLFDDLDSRPAVPREVAKEVPFHASSTQPPPMSKVDSDLFGSNSADEDNDDLFAVPAKKEPIKPFKPPDLPSRPLSIGDVISQAARRSVSSPAPVPVAGGGDIREKFAETAPPVPDFTPPPQEKKIPVGGKSMFGSAGLAITKEALRRRPSSSSSGDSNDDVQEQEIVQNSVGGLLPSSADKDDLFQSSTPVNQNQQSTTRPITQNQSKEPTKSKSVREINPESPSEDDLFAKPKSSTESFSKSKVSHSLTAGDDLFAKPQNSSGLFGEDDKSAVDEDDLFAKPKRSTDIFKTTENDKSVPTAPKPTFSSGLFDAGGSSDEDNLFNPRPIARQSLFSSVPPPLSKSEEKSKKVSLFDDSDSGDDEFLFSSASSAGSRRSQASAEVFNSSTVSVPSSGSVPVEKSCLKKGLFDECNLFSSSLDVEPDIDIFRGVGNDSALPATKSRSTVSSAGTSTATNNTSSVVSGASISGVNAVSTSSSTDSRSSKTTATVPPQSSSAGDAITGSKKPASGVPPSGTSSDDESTTSNVPPSGTSSADESTTSNVPPSGTSSADESTTSNVLPCGASSADESTTLGVPPSGASCADKSITSGVPPFGANSADKSITSGVPPFGASSADASTASCVSPTGLSSAGASTGSKISGSAVPSTGVSSTDASTGLTISESGVAPSAASSFDVPVRSVVPNSAVPATPLLNPNLNHTNSDLFDDDEDLFIVASNSQLPQKSKVDDIGPPINSFTSTIAENLFSGLENETKDMHSVSDELFGDISEDDLFADKSTPNLVPHPVTDKRRSRVDTLFGTDESDGDIFVPRKPTLTISDSIVENKKLKTKVDVPSKVDTIPNKQESIMERKSDAKPETQARPPRTLDIRNTTDPSVISSFEDEDEGEDLFKSVPVESESPAQPEKLSESLPKSGELPKSQCDVAVIVDQPKTMPVPPQKPKKPVPAARKSNFSSFGEKVAVDITRPPEVLPKPHVQSFPKNDVISVLPEDNVSTVEPPLVQKRTPLAGFALNINPLALLPGAQPPSKKTPGEEPVGFDQPIENTSTLHSAQKERVRVSRRRPPSRRARLGVAKVADHAGVNITSPSSALSPSTDEDDLFGVPQELPSDSGPFDGPFDGAPMLSPAEPLITGSDQADSASVDDPLLKLRAETVSESETDGEVADDHSSLFAFVKKKPKEVLPETLFSQAPQLPTKDDDVKVNSDSTVDDFDDDGLFKPSASVKKITDLGSGAKTWNLSDDDDDDDLFSSGISSSKPPFMNSSDTMRKEVREEKKPTHKREPPALSKAPIQQPTLRKTEKPFFDDDDDDDLDDDDLFSCSSSKPPPFPVSKSSPRATKKSTNTPQFKDDLFDDPLSGR